MTVRSRHQREVRPQTLMRRRRDACSSSPRAERSAECVNGKQVCLRRTGTLQATCDFAQDHDIFTSMKMSCQAAPVVDDCLVRCVEPARVAETRERLIDVKVAEGQAEMFKLLGEPGRLRMLYALADAGELCVCDLAATIDGTETAVSHAMRLLRAAGIVRNRRDGRMVYYRLTDDRVHALLELSRPAVTAK